MDTSIVLLAAWLPIMGIVLALCIGPEAERTQVAQGMRRRPPGSDAESAVPERQLTRFSR